MNRMSVLALLAISALLGACAGDDGQDGGVYAIPTWSSDIVAADFSEAGAEAPYTYGEKRALRPGVATIYWQSGTTVYYLVVEIEPGVGGSSGSATMLVIPKDGDDGQDRIYDVYISGDTLFYQERIVPIGASSVNPDAVLEAPASFGNATPGQAEASR